MKKSVAALAGVSSVTVSNVLNERPNVSADTRLKVLLALKKARGQADKKEKTIQTLLPK
jgi:DNA-binding LacI/PurR family transcriptional regulator